MRSVLIAAGLLLGISGTAVFGQPAPYYPNAVGQPGVDAGGRPGHEPGVGVSLPLSNSASNMTSSDSRSTVAPTLPNPAVGPNASARDYLLAARASLIAGQTGASQQSLEMAETRALDRSVAIGQTNVPYTDRLISAIRDARRAMGEGNSRRAIEIIDMALAG